MRVRKMRLYNEVAFLLQQKMTEIELKYQNMPLDKIPEEDAGNFGDSFPDYSWELKSQEFQLPDLSSMLDVNKESNVDMQRMVLKQLNESLGKAIKEIKVSVIVKKNNKRAAETRYTISTYMVDFTKEPNFSGIAGGAIGGAGP